MLKLACGQFQLPVWKLSKQKSLIWWFWVNVEAPKHSFFEKAFLTISSQTDFFFRQMVLQTNRNWNKIPCSNWNQWNAIFCRDTIKVALSKAWRKRNHKKIIWILHSGTDPVYRHKVNKHRVRADGSNIVVFGLYRQTNCHQASLAG